MSISHNKQIKYMFSLIGERALYKRPASSNILKIDIICLALVNYLLLRYLYTPGPNAHELVVSKTVDPQLVALNQLSLY
jgi:hypothetical protein